MPRALITAVTGQDGAYLSQLLLAKGYEVHGLVRRSSSADVVDARLVWLGIRDQVRLHDGNLTDLASIIRVLQLVQPDEIYNLGAQSFVYSSWNQAHLTGSVTGLGATNMLEGMRTACPTARDVVAAYVAAIERSQQLPPSPIINIATGQGHTIGDILSRLIGLSAVQIEIQAAASSPDGPPDRVVGDSSLAANLLEWKPQIGLQETLGGVLTYWRERTQAELAC